MKTNDQIAKTINELIPEGSPLYASVGFHIGFGDAGVTHSPEYVTVRQRSGTFQKPRRVNYPTRDAWLKVYHAAKKQNDRWTEAFGAILVAEGFQIRCGKGEITILGLNPEP